MKEMIIKIVIYFVILDVIYLIIEGITDNTSINRTGSILLYGLAIALLVWIFRVMFLKKKQ